MKIFVTDISFCNLLLGEQGWKSVAQQIVPADRAIFFSELPKESLLPETIVSQVIVEHI